MEVGRQIRAQEEEITETVESPAPPRRAWRDPMPMGIKGTHSDARTVGATSHIRHAPDQALRTRTEHPRPGQRTAAFHPNRPYLVISRGLQAMAGPDAIDPTRAARAHVQKAL